MLCLWMVFSLIKYFMVLAWLSGSALVLINIASLRWATMSVFLCALPRLSPAGRSSLADLLYSCLSGTSRKSSPVRVRTLASFRCNDLFQCLIRRCCVILTEQRVVSLAKPFFPWVTQCHSRVADVVGCPGVGVEPVAHITYTVLEETLNPAQSINRCGAALHVLNDVRTRQ